MKSLSAKLGRIKLSSSPARLVCETEAIHNDELPNLGQVKRIVKEGGGGVVFGTSEGTALEGSRDALYARAADLDAIVATEGFILKNTRVSQHLNNPFIPTNIKLIGDSITAGVGGTGYSTSGQPIIYDSYRQNNLMATCWANMLYNYVTNVYNRDNIISFLHPGITNTAGASLSYNVTGNGNIELLNTAPYVGTGLSFTFYGNHFDIGYVALSTCGILDVYIDDVYHSSIDAYAASYSHNLTYSVSGLSTTYHTVEIRQTNTKNAASTGYLVYLKWLQIPKTATVINYGISGIDSSDVYFKRTSLIQNTDDIVVLQIGTNDRAALEGTMVTGLNKLKSNITKIKEYTDSLNIDLILMIANPANPANETLSYRMYDTHNAIIETSTQLQLEVVNNYQAVLDYCRYRGVALSTILADDLHPNDTGYQIMFENIMKEFGLARLTDGLSY